MRKTILAALMFVAIDCSAKPHANVTCGLQADFAEHAALNRQLHVPIEDTMDYIKLVYPTWIHPQMRIIAVQAYNDEDMDRLAFRDKIQHECTTAEEADD